jgi:hypothetical protein
MFDFIMASRRPAEVCQQPIKYPKIPVPTRLDNKCRQETCWPQI